MVFISRLRLRNFKSFKAADLTLSKSFVVFAGPNGSGKCVDGSTEIFLSDGSVRSIGELVNDAITNGDIEKIDDGYIARYDKAPEILSLDTKTLKVTKKRIGALVKRTSPKKMLKVRTRSGREIIATEYHPFFILRGDQIRSIRADELKEKIRIAIPQRIDARENDCLFLELLDEIKQDDNVYVPFNKRAARIIATKKGSRSWAQLEREMGVPKRSLDSFVCGEQSIRFPELVKTLRYCGVLDIEIADIITEIKSHGKEQFRMIWKNSNEFCRFLGYLLAEGSTSKTNNQVRLTNGSPEILADYINLAKNLFGLNPQMYKYKPGTSDVIIYSEALKRILLKFGMSYDGAGGKHIPEILFRHSNTENLANIISGLFAGDGYVSKSSIEITLKSERLIRGSERILLRMGIVARTKRISKVETKTRFRGDYHKLSIFGSAEHEKFHKYVNIVHKEKHERIEKLLHKKQNSNVDLIEANDLVKEAAHELDVKIKNSKYDFPRLDAYCYNQCLPTRHGIVEACKYLKSVSVQKHSNAIEKLEMLAKADIFWDEIEKIEQIEPREEWVYDLTIPDGHNFIANGIFVHNSNLCDAIRFVMGETSLKSLRAHKVRELIHSDSKSAEVTICFSEDENGRPPAISEEIKTARKGKGKKGKEEETDADESEDDYEDEEAVEASPGAAVPGAVAPDAEKEAPVSGNYEIKRAIREDGKILYRMNGKRTTRTAVLEALKKHNLDSSGRNTVAQGEVQRVISMNGRERREIIDSVAGIADFEAKKKEAMGELTTVETRIKDANLILGERRAFLEELEREREIAMKFIDARKTFTSAKATLLKVELERLEKEVEVATESEEKNGVEKGRLEKEMAKLDGEIKEVEGRRAILNEELRAKQGTHSMIRRIEELKASIGSRGQAIIDKDAIVARCDVDGSAMNRDINKITTAKETLAGDIAGLRVQLEEAEERFRAHGGSTEDIGIKNAKEQVEKCEKEFALARERIATLNSEIGSKKELIEAKKAEIEAATSRSGGVGGSGGTSGAKSSNDDPTSLRKESSRIGTEIDSLFKRTKEINNEMIELDRKMLELKEKVSIFKVRSSPQLANPALSFVADLKKKGDRRILGMVADLISFEPKFTAAVEAAAGSRLLYIVVDGVDTATEVIGQLKAARVGRATFIPLDSIRTGAKPAVKGAVPILDVVDAPANAVRAIEYVFGETVLVNTAADAKKLGVGGARMVTLEGEIFERSGIISGGRSESSLLGASALKKLEGELAEVRTNKDGLMTELYSIRDQESKLRAERAQYDVRLKALEMQEQMFKDKDKENEAVIRRGKQLEDEIKEARENIAMKEGELKRMGSAAHEMEEKIAAAKAALDAEEAALRAKSEKSSKQLADLSGKVSSLRATIDGKMTELKLRTEELAQKEERAKEIAKERKTNAESITENKRAINSEKNELATLEERISSVSKAIEQLFERVKKCEVEFAELGKKNGTKRGELDKVLRDLAQVEVKKASAATHLVDIKVEFERYKDAELMSMEDIKREELVKLVADSERVMASMGNVNMASIEMYEKRKSEIMEVETRIKTLDTEREAIMSMISEIDEHKREAFMETFDAVSRHFSGMFKHVDIGEGHLSLDNPNLPFESGLYIKIRRNNKEHSIDALSGGEKTLVALMFLFALQLYKPAPFYVLDEIDAALDSPNCKRLSRLITNLGKESQFIIVSHKDLVMSNANSVIGVSKIDGVSHVVGVKLTHTAAAMQTTAVA